MDWSVKVPLHTLGRDGVRVELRPTEAERADAAKLLAIPGVPSLSAEVTVAPWMDGCEIQGRWRAVVTQVCGVTVDAFNQAIEGDFTVRAVPAGSPNAPSEDPEVEIDLDAEDPPDVLHAPEVDVAAYVVEHLALELDPFPRKPGVEFEPPEPEMVVSPFDELRKLKPN